MARITVEDCLENISNRFSLVLVAAERTRQLLKGSESLIQDQRTNKEVVTALREIAAGSVVANVSKVDPDELHYGAPSARNDTLPAAADDLPPVADEALPPAADG